jgi:uncharacterized membrane protein
VIPGSSRQRAPNCSISELTRQNVHTVAQLEAAAGEHRQMADRVADGITAFAGSMLFVYLHVAWFALWILFNTLPVVPQSWRFDPFPFTFLTLVVSLEAIFLSTFILISQNHEEKLAERRSQLDLQVTLLSEQENSKMLLMLESIQQKLGIEVDPEVKQLEEATEPAEIVHEIELEFDGPGERC